MNDVVLDDSTTSASKAKRGVPTWYQGKVSSAFAKHIYWPSPTKKTSTTRRVLFPSCASSQQWRDLHRQQVASKSIQKGKENSEMQEATTTQQKSTKVNPTMTSMNKSVPTEHSKTAEVPATKPTRQATKRKQNDRDKSSRKSQSKKSVLSTEEAKRVKRGPSATASITQKKQEEGTARNKAKSKKENSKHAEGSDDFVICCLFCHEVYVDPPSEEWISCAYCKQWAHEECTDYSGNEYVCDFCK